MDSEQQPPPPQHHHHHHYHHPPHPHIMVGHAANSFPTPPTATTTSTTTTTGTAAAPPLLATSSATTTTSTHSSSLPVMSQQHQIQNPNPNLTRFPFNSMVNSSSSAGPALDYSDKSGSPPRASGVSIEPARKKRGRPRKYSSDGNISLGLSPTPVTAMTPAGGVSHGDFSGGGTPSSEPSVKRRGRPPGSGKRQLNALGTMGVGFTPHVITVKAGEDIASKVMAFAQQGPRAVCILSANGAICNVTLRQGTISGGTVTYEGRFEIIYLSGSFIPSDGNGSRNQTGGLSVSLAGPDGRVFGGGVAGMLMAASAVQVVVGSFTAGGKKSKPGPLSSHAPNMLNFGAPVTEASPPSQGTSSDSSEDDGGSPLNHGQGPYSNPSQPMSMPMYTNMGWPNSTVKMHPN